MLNPKLSSGSALVSIVIAVVAATAIESNLLSAKERADNPPRVIDRAYCTKCHSDSGMLNKMQAKEGRGHFIFHEAGQPPVSDVCPRTQVVTPVQKW